MSKPKLSVFYKSVKGSADEIKDWYSHFSGHTGTDLVIHEYEHLEADYENIGSKLITVFEFMDGEYPDAAKLALLETRQTLLKL